MQGCPLSSSLFILCLEILSNYINANTMIKGIKINDQEITLSGERMEKESQGQDSIGS